MHISRIIAGVYLIFLMIYFGDKYTEFSFFNISQLLDYKLLLLPTFLVMLLMPKEQMVRKYKADRDKEKNKDKRDTTTNSE